MISDDLSEYLDGDEFRSICEKANRTDAAEQRAAQLEAELKSAREAADISDGMPLDEWIIAARNDHIVMTNDRNVTQAELDDTIKQRQFWFAKFNEIARERDMYKQGFDALTTANEQIVMERDEANKKLKEYYAHNSSVIMALYAIDNDVFGPLTVKEGIAELVKQRDDARAALSREEYKRMVAESKIKELEDDDAHFSRALSEALNEGDGVYRP